MKRRVQKVGIMAIAIVIGSLTTSCNSKVNQCKNIIQVVNQTVIDTKNITDLGTKGDPSSMEKVSQRYEQAAKDLEGVSVEDPKLSTYQKQFVLMYQSSAQVAKQVAESIKTKKSSQVLRGLNQFQLLVSPEKDLVEGINQYCKEAEK
jgi:hypothetical protein